MSLTSAEIGRAKDGVQAAVPAGRVASAGGAKKRTDYPMFDFIFIAATVVFFVAASAYTRACDRV